MGDASRSHSFRDKGGVDIDRSRGSSDRRLRADLSSVEPGIETEEMHVDVEAHNNHNVESRRW